jgi:hypothetical protein
MKVTLNELRRLVRQVIQENELNNFSKETVEEFISRFEKENRNPNFLINHFKNPNFRLELTHDGNVKTKGYNCALPNKCEANTFNFIKDMVKLNNHRYYPVSGWAFLDSTSYFEHFWVYDSMSDSFLDVTPMGNNIPYAYGGVVNFDINDEILNAEKYSDIDFLLGKAGHSLYKTYQDNLPNKILNKGKVNKNIFDFIHKSEKYRELSKFISENNVKTVEELKQYVVQLENKRDSVRNNRDWDYYTKLIDQIKALDF